MGEREKKELILSLQRSSIAGTAIMGFVLAFVVLYQAGMNLAHVIFISGVFSLVTTLARSRSRL